LLCESEFREAESSAAPLRTEPNAPVLWLAKIFYSDSTPVIYSETSIPLELGELEKRELEALREQCAKPVYHILAESFGWKVHHQTSEIRAVLAEELTAHSLDYEVGYPLLSLEEVGYSAEQKPLYHAIHRFRADQVSFRLVRRPVLNIAGNGG
jgi:DNA-binding GntR family transcriptional regulator